MLYHLYRLGRALTLRLSIEACYKIAIFCADLYYIFAKNDKRCLKENLSVILGTNDKKVIREHTKNVFRNFAKYLADFFRFSKLTREYIMEHILIEGKEYLDKALTEGKGGVLLSAHLGNWELGGAITGSLGYPLYAIALEHKDKRINDFFVRQRALCDVKVISIGAQLKNCFRVLRQNKFLAIVGDRDFYNRGIDTEFFGRTAQLPRGAAFFSLRTGAPIIPVFVIRKSGNKFRMVIDKPIKYKHKIKTKEDEKKAIDELMQQYVAILEKYIKAYPDQWYAFRKIWE